MSNTSCYSEDAVSTCCEAPVVTCKGDEWDVKEVHPGQTYYYGCTACKKPCDVNDPEEAKK